MSEAMRGSDGKPVVGGWLGVDQALGDRGVAIRIAQSAEADWLNSRTSFAGVAAPLLDCLPLEQGVALIWSLPASALPWSDSAISREQRASLVVDAYRAIRDEREPTTWISVAPLYAVRTALGVRPWVIPAARDGQSADSAKAENLHALAAWVLLGLYGVSDTASDEAIGRVPAGVVTMLAPWRSDEPAERLVHLPEPSELASALGVNERSDRVPVPTASVSTSTTTRNRVAAARELATRVTRREGIAFFVLLLLLAVGFVSLLGHSDMNVDELGVQGFDVAVEGAVAPVDVVSNLNAVPQASRLRMPEPDLASLPLSALVRDAATAEVCLEAVDNGPVPELVGCGLDLFPYQPRVHVFRDAAGRIELIESYEFLGHPVGRRKYRYGLDGQLSLITTTTLAMATVQDQHVDMQAGTLTMEPSFVDDMVLDCWRWQFTLDEQGRYTRISCAERPDAVITYERRAQYEAQQTQGSHVVVTERDEDGSVTCTSTQWVRNGFGVETCFEYRPSAQDAHYTYTQDGKVIGRWRETHTFLEGGELASTLTQQVDAEGQPTLMQSAVQLTTYEREGESLERERRQTFDGDGSLASGDLPYDTLVTVRNPLGSPVSVSTTVGGEAAPTVEGVAYTQYTQTFDSAGRLTSRSFWDANGEASSAGAVHRFAWTYDEGTVPTSERAFDPYGRSIRSPFEVVSWQRDSSGAVRSVEYLVDGELISGSHAYEGLTRNGEGRVSRRCVYASDGQLGAASEFSAVPGVQCVETEWLSLSRVRHWFLSSEDGQDIPQTVTLGGLPCEGVELEFQGNRVTTMGTLRSAQRGPGGPATSVVDCATSACVGLTGLWFSYDEPGSALR